MSSREMIDVSDLPLDFERWLEGFPLACGRFGLATSRCLDRSKMKTHDPGTGLPRVALEDERPAPKTRNHRSA